MKLFLKLLIVCCLYTWSLNTIAQVRDNVTGLVKCQGKGMHGVIVTDGFDCVLTDAGGNFSLPYNRNAHFIYMTTPSGYLPESKNSLPLFYKKLDEKEKNYDFSLLKNPHDDNKHMFLVQADVQVSKNSEIEGYKDYLKDVAQFVNRYRKKSDVFVLDCGDIVGNTFSLYPSYIQASDTLELPFYRTIGNHDMEYGVRSHEHSYSTFEQFFGPIYYSFNRGKAHYIVLNNCFYVNRHYQYIGYIDERTLQWMEKDLSFVPKDHLVFVMIHIPSSSTKELQFNTLLPNETSNASALYEILDGYDAHILSGHTHRNQNVVFNDKLMEHTTAAVSATFWKSDICTDGTPRGFGVYEVDGNKVSWIYKSVNFPSDYQFRAYPVGSSEEYPEDIIVNVWNRDEQWKVEWYENGKSQGEMEHFSGYDPEAKAICSDKERVEYDWITPIKTKHLFRARPQNKEAVIEIVVTDRFGNIYKQKIPKEK